MKTQSLDLQRLHRLFQLQKANYSPSTTIDYQKRMDRLQRLDRAIRENIDPISEALSSDFGTRSADWSFNADIYPVLHHIEVVMKNLKSWMKPVKKTSLAMRLTGEKSYLLHEPLGVIGIVTPFNAPVSLALDPAIEALAAGNSVIIKVSENTPHTGRLLQAIIEKYFKEEEMAVVNGDLPVSVAFSNLPWDLFFFTGGSEVGKKVLSAVGAHLTPAILELGGKSPCVILEGADVKAAATKISTVRVLNAGQVCISGDYALVPARDVNTFISTCVDHIRTSYPTMLDNPNYTSIINKAAFDRITGYIDEAKKAGVKVISVKPDNESLPDPATRKIPLTIVIDPPENLKVAQEEIFGPILTVFSYQNLDQAINAINQREKALALYIFGKDKKAINKVIQSTSSGGVTVNDLMMHANASKMGFGGVGYSGMGRYKGGQVGFLAFTNPKTVVEQGLMSRFTGVFMPPYKNEFMRNFLRRQVGVK